MTVVKFQSSRAPKEAPAGSADRDAPPAPHADTDAAAGGEGAAAKRVRVERGIYRQPNGKYAVCFMLDGRPRFRTVGYDLELARRQRETLARAASYGVLACAPRLSFAKLAGWWLERYERKVKTGQCRERTLALHRYHLKRHLLPSLGPKLARAITAQDIVDLIERLRSEGRSERTIANALHTLNNIVRFAVRSTWIAENPLEKLERDERPHPVRFVPRVLDQQEIAALLGACTPGARTLIATALYTGLRISELLGLTWSDLDLGEGTLRVRAQLSLASRGRPARRVAPKTSAASRQIPLPPALTTLLLEHKNSADFGRTSNWVFATSKGTPRNQRNVHRLLADTVHRAGLDQSTSRLRFHDLRHTYASHLIIDVGLDVVQASRLLGHASPATTLGVYAHMFDFDRHAADLRRRVSASAFVALLEQTTDTGQRDVNVIPFPTRVTRKRSTPRGHVR
ncbi:MAG TPA: tyrosine-type recombinase/integrase [Solirubrobacteraceae bacterium]|nr:tyrosine-type recombinase/integrase [Solirubrobacteraceae bacterium]